MRQSLYLETKKGESTRLQEKQLAKNQVYLHLSLLLLVFLFLFDPELILTISCLALHHSFIYSETFVVSSRATANAASNHYCDVRVICSN